MDLIIRLLGLGQEQKAVTTTAPIKTNAPTDIPTAVDNYLTAKCAGAEDKQDAAISAGKELIDEVQKYIIAIGSASDTVKDIAGIAVMEIIEAIEEGVAAFVQS